MILFLFGSLGLFLLGMWMLTEGLKLAGGNLLHRMLSKWTSSRMKGLFSGILITSLVQSSSAVTIASIGFVNARLMTFQRAVWVVFGSNVGTTFTAWIIALLGFRFDIEGITFPLIGLGAFVHLLAPNEKHRALGLAIAGFGLLFMGIDELKTNFSAYANQLDVTHAFTQYQYKSLTAFLLGVVLTVLTQSSSAAIAIILTAVASNVIGIHEAASAVIGANIGTTSTAILASIGATNNAKRLAWAHVIFNLLTAAVALLLLPILWFIVSHFKLSIETNPIIAIAIFHTSFNLLGVALILPVEPRLTKWLLNLYKNKLGQVSPLTHLDANVASIPEIANRALKVELEVATKDFGRIKFPINKNETFNYNAIPNIETRLAAINNFIALALKAELTDQQGQILTLSLSVSHHLKNAIKTFQRTVEKFNNLSLNYTLPDYLNQWLAAVNQFNHDAIFNSEFYSAEKLQLFKQNYRLIKTQLLETVAQQKYQLEAVDTALQAASLARRFSEQIAQAMEAYQALNMQLKDESKSERLTT